MLRVSLNTKNPRTPAGRLFVYAGPISLGSSLGLGVKVGVDKTGLRMLNLTFPGTLSIDSLLSIVGSSAPAGLGDLFSLKDSGLVWILDKGTTGEPAFKLVLVERPKFRTAVLLGPKCCCCCCCCLASLACLQQPR